MHWLDDTIAMIRTDAHRWRASHGEKAAHLDTAADILQQVALDGKTHDEVRADIAELTAAAPEVFDETGATPAPGTNEYTGAVSHFRTDDASAPPPA